MSPEQSISVIIPVYNAEKYVGIAIESVLRQTVEPFEIVVVNDGSTDKSAKLAEKFTPRVSLINQENKGISGARNTGIKAAKGTMIAFLDADDIWTDHHLEKLLAPMNEDEDVHIVSGHVKQFISEDVNYEVHQIPMDQEIMPGYLAGATLIKKEIFDKVGLFNEDLIVAEYVDWFSRVKDAGISFKMIDDIILKRRIHSQNTGIQQRHHRLDYIRALKESIKRKKQKDSGDD